MMHDTLEQFLRCAARLEADAAEGYDTLADAIDGRKFGEVEALFTRFAGFSRMHMEEVLEIQRRELAKVCARLIHHPSCCGTARPASAAFRSVAHPQRTGEYACGVLGRETPQPLGLTTPRDGRVVNKAGEVDDDRFEWPNGFSPENPLAIVDLQGITPEKALEYALEVERRACDFYSHIAGRTRSPRVQELAQEFAEEEAEHVDHIERWLERTRRFERGGSE